MSSESVPRTASGNQDTEELMKTCIRKYNKEMKMLEYSRLRSLVPSIALQPRVSKIQVIEEAIKYIAQLQETLAARFETPNQDGELPSTTEAQSNERRPKLVREKRQRFASYMIKAQRHTLASRRKVGGRTVKRQSKQQR